MIYTRLFAGDVLPSRSDLDMLVIMGGPMSVNDTNQYVWLKDELAFLEKSIAAGKRILGICLGAQLLAKSLGSRVYKSDRKEIGWLQIVFEPERHKLFSGLTRKQELNVFQWHGETFDLPSGGTRLFSSKACINQAFLYHEHVLALQFHIELTGEGIASIIDNCRSEIAEGEYIQSEAEILRGIGILCEKNQLLLFDLLDRFATV